MQHTMRTWSTWLTRWCDCPEQIWEDGKGIKRVGWVGWKGSRMFSGTKTTTKKKEEGEGGGEHASAVRKWGGTSVFE